MPDGHPAGSSVVQSVSGGCALLENWTSGSGGHGKSLNAYNPAIKQWQQTPGVLAIHHVDHEDDFGRGEITLDCLPFIFSKLRAEVADCQAQVKPVLAIDLALRIAQRGQQA